MTTQNEPRHGVAEQQWWNQQQPATSTAQHPPQIPAQRTAGWSTPPQPPQSPRKLTARSLAKWFGLVVAAVLVLAVGIAIGGSGRQTATVAAAPAGSSGADQARIATLEQQLADAQRINQGLQTQVDSQTVAPPAATAPAVPVAPVETGLVANVSDGTYEVGEDIETGRYKTDGPGSTDILDSCYMQRSKDDSGELGSIIANDNLTGPSSVTVKDGEFVTFNGGCAWVKQ